MSNEILLKLQQTYNKMDEDYRILKDRSTFEKLSLMKNEFDKTKKKYLDEKIKLDNLNKKIYEVNREIEDIKKEINDKEYDLYNKYGNDVKMIDKLQKEIKDKNHISEEKNNVLLSLLEDEEEISNELKEMKDKLDGIKEDFYNRKNQVTLKIKECKKEYEECKENIIVLKNKLSKDKLKEFESLKERKRVAVAVVKNGVCTGCKVKISTMTIDELNKGKKIVHCDNCGRIIVLDKEI